MLKQLTILLLATQLTHQACDKGCLRCNDKTECLICDTTQFFTYDSANKTCQTVTSENCLYLDLNGDCAFCEAGYFLNSSTKACVAIESTVLTENPQCEYWSSATNCSDCADDYLIVGTKCEAVTTAVANCDVYTSKTQCASCQSKYTLVENECVELPQTNKCLNYSDFQCTACGANFWLNENLVQKSFGDLESDTERALAIAWIRANVYGDVVLQNHQVCEAITVENCLVLASFNSCQTCVSTHYLTDDNLCKINPNPVIQNCVHYSSHNVCTECAEGFFKKTAQLCEAVESVEKCAKHSTTASSTQCIECQSGYYLQSVTSCKERTNASISQCQTYNVDKDSCYMCNTGYVGSGSLNNYTACLEEVDNCAVHTITGTTVTCSSCIEGYYKDAQGVCVVGTIDNCKTYEQDQTSPTCSVCENTYRLATNTCVAHEVIQNCDQYDPSRINFCNTCSKGFFSVRLATHCDGEVFSPINNCKVYDANQTTQSQCTTCEDEYYLASSTSCSAITIDNCAQTANNTSCDTCSTGYGLVNIEGSNNNTCSEPLLSVSQNCLAFSLNNDELVNEQECKTCKAGHYGYSTENHHICVRNDRVPSLQNHFTLISGCALYSSEDPVTCIRCEDGMFLDPANEGGANACTATCTNTILALGPLDGDDYVGNIANNWIPSVRRNQCIDIATVAVAVRQVDANIPLSCRTAHLAVITTDETGYSYVNPGATNQNWVDSLRVVYPELAECVDYSGLDVNNENDPTSLPQHCQYFYSPETDIFMCAKCIHTRSGLPSNVDIGGTIYYYLSCGTVDNCDDVVYGHLPVTWAKLLGCHKCKGTNEVPIWAGLYDGTDFTGFQRWSASTDNGKTEFFLGDPGQNDTETGNAVETCVSHTANDFATFTGGSGNFSVIQNCGMYYLDISATMTDLAAAITCGFCEPGYKSTLTNGVISACTEIQNCKANPTNPWVNACSECEENFTWEYDTNNDVVDYTSCVSSGTQNENCFAFDGTNCVLCKKGFNLNADNYCEVIQAAHCQNGRYFNNYVQTALSDDLYLQEYMFSYQIGCEQCESGFSAIANNAARYAMAQNSCHSTDYINDTKTYEAQNDSLYIKNCLNYSTTVQGSGGDDTDVADKHRQCEVCASGYILTEDKRECLSASENANCVIAMSRGANGGCRQCATTHGRTKPGNNYVCVENSIENCKIPDYSGDNNSTIECMQCNDGYYYNTTNRKCLRGNVDFCVDHPDNDGNSCNTCQTGYIVISDTLTSSNNQEGVTQISTVSRDYCLSIPTGLGCASGDISRYNTEMTGYALFTCNSCTQPHRIPLTINVPSAQTDMIDNACFPFNAVSNCEEYLVDSKLEDSNFSCTQCSNQYFRERLGYTCTERTNVPANCQTYDLSEDKCLVCENNSYINNDGTACIDYPDGVVGCIAYNTVDSVRVCSACDGTQYFLQDGNCVFVESRDANCIQVAGENTCEVCKTGYFLNPTAKGDLTNHCESATGITNCLELESATSCKVCALGYRLDNSGTGGKCVDIADVNCVLFNDSAKCEVCKQNYYPDTSTTHYTCKTVGANVITSCLQNATELTCKLCSSGTALSADAKSCKNKGDFDVNCQVQNMPAERVCSRCEKGFYLEGGVCTAYTGVASFASGCLIPNDDASACDLCYTGYHMNSDYSCSKDVTTTTTEPGTGEGVSIMRMFVYLLCLVVF